MRSRHCPVEPLIPTEQYQVGGFDRFFSASFQGIHDLVWGDLGSRARVRAESTEDVRVSVALTRAQSIRGGRIRVWIAIQTRCPACWGQGRAGYLECGQCSGRGFVEEECPVLIALPAGVLDGSIARVPLDRLGLDSVYLLVHFQVLGE